jgi:DNA-binding beta-propeller fold protein YncE
MVHRERHGTGLAAAVRENVLPGTVVRIVAHVDNQTISIHSITTIASGFAFRTDPAALVIGPIGPTGLAWDPETDELFVADTGANRIAELDHVSTAAFDQGPGSTGDTKGFVWPL